MPSKINVSTLVLTAWTILKICCAITDNTSMSIRLNSLKHAQVPDEANPLKNYQYIFIKTYYSIIIIDQIDHTFPIVK